MLIKAGIRQSKILKVWKKEKRKSFKNTFKNTDKTKCSTIAWGPVIFNAGGGWKIFSILPNIFHDSSSFSQTIFMTHPVLG